MSDNKKSEFDWKPMPASDDTPEDFRGRLEPPADYMLMSVLTLTGRAPEAGELDTIFAASIAVSLKRLADAGEKRNQIISERVLFADARSAFTSVFTSVPNNAPAAQPPAKE